VVPLTDIAADPYGGALYGCRPKSKKDTSPAGAGFDGKYAGNSLLARALVSRRAANRD